MFGLVQGVLFVVMAVLVFAPLAMVLVLLKWRREYGKAGTQHYSDSPTGSVQQDSIYVKHSPNTVVAVVHALLEEPYVDSKWYWDVILLLQV